MDPTTQNNLSDERMPFWKKRRNLVVFLTFLCFFNLYTLGVNISVAIVAMTSSTDTKISEFEWDSKVRGTILSALSYGFIVTQLFGGILNTKLGGVKPMGYGILMTAIFTVLTPVAARYSVNLVFGIRVIEGAFQGIAYPGIHAVWSKWIPPEERTKLASFAFSGCFVGMIVGYPVSGWLAEHWGWPYIFYVPGIVAMLWSAIWLTCIVDSPEDDKQISKEELKHIIDSIGPTDNKKISILNYPWKDIFTSMPVWAINCAHFCANWGSYTLITQLPSYMNDVLKFDVQKGSFLSALPYAALAVILQFNGFLVYWIRQKNVLTNTQVRKIFNSAAFFSQTVFMFSAAHTTTKHGAIICLILAVSLEGFVWGGFHVNHLDLSPQYGSLLLGISSTFGTIPGLITPMLTGYIVQNKSAEEWKLVFYITCGMYIFGGLFYVVFSSGDRQPWSEIKTEEKATEGRDNKTFVS